jgi:hypothetical protein
MMLAEPAWVYEWNTFVLIAIVLGGIAWLAYDWYRR